MNCQKRGTIALPVVSTCFNNRPNCTSVQLLPRRHDPMVYLSFNNFFVKICDFLLYNCVNCAFKTLVGDIHLMKSSVYYSPSSVMEYVGVGSTSVIGLSISSIVAVVVDIGSRGGDCSKYSSSSTFETRFGESCSSLNLRSCCSSYENFSLLINNSKALHFT